MLEYCLNFGKIIKEKKLPYCLIISWAIYVFFCSFSWDQLLHTESIYQYDNSTSLLRALTMYAHPPIHNILIYFTLMIFGQQHQNAYIFSILCNLVSLLLTYLIGKNLEKTTNIPNIANLSVLLMAICPYIILGSFQIECDPSLLTVAVLFYIYYILKNINSVNLARNLGIMFFILLWIKESTPVLIHLPAIIFLMIYRKKELFKFPLISFIVPLLLFLITYGIYSHLAFGDWGAIRFNFMKFGPQTMSKDLQIMGIIQRLVLLTVWILPVTALGYGFFIFKKDKRVEINLLKTISLFFLIVMIIRAVSISFPRYYSPILPLIFLGFSMWILPIDFKNKSVLKILIVLLLFLMPYYLMRKDWYLPIYLYVNGESNVKEVAMSLLLVGLPIIAAFCFIRNKIYFKLILLMIYITQAISLGSFQARANYSTNHQYGTKGLEKTLVYIKKNIPLNEQNKIYFPFYDYHFNRNNVLYSDYSKIRKWTEFGGCIYVVGRKYDFEKKYPITEKERETLLQQYKTIAVIDSYIIKKK